MKLLLCSLAIFASVYSQKLPNYIVPCARNKPDFHQCCIDNGVKAIPYILKGDRAQRIPPLAPLKLPKVAIEANNNFRITLTDLVVSGIDTVTLKDVVFDFDKNLIKVALMMDYLTVVAQYDIDGSLIVPLQGKGPANITSIRPYIEYEVDFSIVQKDGKEYMNVEKDRLQLNSQEAYYQLDNLFGNPQLSAETNKILNENAKDVGKELNGPITQTIRTIVTGLITGYLTRVPLDMIFLKE
ncbi:hemolymph juvenile hormone binding protein (JHBP) [Popillia japonica]|uniref:Hemolymph juvenile hormone binding protein (JHBP) n=1 Tax=Popillia japonica TaxID=7064 RepID=A0AAW1LQZ5_POPJA